MCTLRVFFKILHPLCSMWYFYSLIMTSCHFCLSWKSFKDVSFSDCLVKEIFSLTSSAFKGEKTGIFWSMSRFVFFFLLLFFLLFYPFFSAMLCSSNNESHILHPMSMYVFTVVPLSISAGKKPKGTFTLNFFGVLHCKLTLVLLLVSFFIVWKHVISEFLNMKTCGR